MYFTTLRQSHLGRKILEIKYRVIVIVVHLKVIAQVEMIDNCRAVLVEVVLLVIWYICPNDFHIVVSVRSTLFAKFCLVNSFPKLQFCRGLGIPDICP